MRGDSMEKERYGDIISELAEIGRLRREYGIRNVDRLFIISSVAHAIIFYLVSLVSLKVLIISVGAYLCSLVMLVIGLALRQDVFFKRHEVHAVTLQDEVIRLQQLVQDYIIDDKKNALEDHKEVTPSVYS